MLHLTDAIPIFTIAAGVIPVMDISVIVFLLKCCKLLKMKGFRHFLFCSINVFIWININFDTGIIHEFRV